MILDASQAPPSVAPNREARREEFDPSLASHGPFSQDEVLPRPSIRKHSSDGRVSAIGLFSSPFPSLPSSIMLTPLFQGRSRKHRQVEPDHCLLCQGQQNSSQSSLGSQVIFASSSDGCPFTRKKMHSFARDTLTYWRCVCLSK